MCFLSLLCVLWPQCGGGQRKIIYLHESIKHYIAAVNVPEMVSSELHALYGNEWTRQHLSVIAVFIFMNSLLSLLQFPVWTVCMLRGDTMLNLCFLSKVYFSTKPSNFCRQHFQQIYSKIIFLGFEGKLKFGFCANLFLFKSNLPELLVDSWTMRKCISLSSTKDKRKADEDIVWTAMSADVFVLSAV